MEKVTSKAELKIVQLEPARLKLITTRYCQIKSSLFEGGFGNGFGNNNNIIPCIFGGRSEETSEADIDPGNLCCNKNHVEGVP